MTGDLERRVQLGERLEREPSFREARMGDGQPGLVDDLVAVEEQVEVDQSRAEAGAFAPPPAELLLDREQAVEELVW